MSLRIPLLFVIAAFAGIGPRSDVVAGDKTHSETPKLVTQAYPVADLVATFPGIGVLCFGDEVKASSRSAPPQADFEGLIDEITTRVEPASWNAAGGQGVIAAEPTTLSLVVRQTQAVHDQIAELLNQMRRDFAVQICIEVRRAEVPDEFLHETVGSKDRTKLDERAMKSLMDAVQNHTRANLIWAPKVTVFDGTML